MADDITDAEIAALREVLARAAKLCPLPWANTDNFSPNIIDAKQRWIAQTRFTSGYVDIMEAARDAVLTVNSLAPLLSRLERAERERDEAREALGHLVMAVQKEIAAEHRALDEWRESGGPDWRDDHPAIARLKRLVELTAIARAALGGSRD